LEVDSSITGRKVGAVLNRIAIFRGLPKEILTDNGPEFTSNAPIVPGNEVQMKLPIKWFGASFLKVQTSVSSRPRIYKG